MRHFDVQLIGGITLHRGMISEMRTGEARRWWPRSGLSQRAQAARACTSVTVNEYLAQRDADWMGPVYRFLGLSVGVIKNAQSPQEKRAAYACDITPPTHNNESRLRLLRDTCVPAWRPGAAFLELAVVDEVDSISHRTRRARRSYLRGPPRESTELYLRINELVTYACHDGSEGAPGTSHWRRSEAVHITEAGHEQSSS